MRMEFQPIQRKENLTHWEYIHFKDALPGFESINSHDIVDALSLINKTGTQSNVSVPLLLLLTKDIRRHERRWSMVATKE